MLAGLNHPNIGAIYTVEETRDGQRFLVIKEGVAAQQSNELIRGALVRGIEAALCRIGAMIDVQSH